MRQEREENHVSPCTLIKVTHARASLKCVPRQKASYLSGSVFHEALAYLRSAWSPALKQRTTLDVRTRLVPSVLLTVINTPPPSTSALSLLKPRRLKRRAII